MTNEEKSKKIAMPCPACPCIWTKEKMYNQEYCKDCVPQDRFTGAMEMAQWKDEQYKTAYVVTRSEEHCDYVEKVFFDKEKAEEYCKPFNEDENSYHRDITKIEVTL